MRERDKLFVAAYMREIDAGKSEREAGLIAVRESRDTVLGASGAYGDEAVARIAEAKLRKAVIREALADYLEAATGMTPGEMLSIRVGIARGEGIDPRTTPLQLRALEGLEKLTFVPPTQRVEVDQRTHLSAVMMNDLGSSVPAMNATRVLETSMPGAERLDPVTLDADEEEPEL